jgi:cell division protein FtsB
MIRGLVEMMKARQESEAMEQRLAGAKAENARMRQTILRLRTDRAAIEDLARQELGLIKPGEKLFTIRDIEPDGTLREDD